MLIASDLSITPAYAGTYDAPAQSAAQWLESQQNAGDGSWGSTPALQQIQTVSTVRALFAYNRRNAPYYAGLAWVKNENSGNNDYMARRAILLAETGASTTADFQTLLASQQNAFPGNSGWGITSDYNGSALDTALALQAIQNSGIIFDATAAVAFLTSTQLTGTDNGWSLIPNDGSDAVSNAQVIIALSPYQATDATLATPLANAVATLTAQVTVSSPVQLQALAAQALLLNNSASTAGKALLTGLVSQQAGGNWGGDIYATAAVLQAMADADANDLAAQRIRVSIPDANLQTAINLALGHGAMDQINQGEMALLTSLNIANLGITSLTGLQYAINLTSLNAANNNIIDTTPLKNLTGLTTEILDGNPCPGCTPTAQVPVPDWALIVLAALLLYVPLRKGKAVNPWSRQHLGALALLAAVLQSPSGFAQSVPAVNGSSTAPASALTTQQTAHLQQLGGQILQAYAVRESALKQEADTLRAQLQPLKDGLAALENQITQDIRQSNQLGSSIKQLNVQAPVEVAQPPLQQASTSRAPFKRQFTFTPQRAAKIFTVQASVRDNTQAISPQAQNRRNQLLEQIAALRGGQLVTTKVINRATVEGQLDGLRDRLESLPSAPGQMLATVKDLRKSLNPPEPQPYIAPDPTRMTSPVIYPKSNNKPTRK